MTEQEEDDSTFDYIFGFGSIINTETHAPWLAGHIIISNSSQHNNNQQHAHCLPGQKVSLRNYQRGWNFRSNTGFTALGVEKCNTNNDDDEPAVINGVLFRMPRSMLGAFDRREVGYDRVELTLEDLIIEEPPSNTNGFVFDKQEHEKIWIYVPQKAYCLEADEDHPILQSYVDTVLQGCLEWGGEDMARQFIATTGNWSSFFLNDTPSSRRPWLFRKQYADIDRLLLQYADRTRFEDRRHPEEFSKAFLNHMRGTWSLPQRNKVFTGRDSAIGEIHAKLVAQRAENGQTSLAKLEIVGMGGIGKTSVCVEYCYRYFPSYYGLVVWLSAQGAESITFGFKQLMADTTGVDVKDKNTDEVIAEVKARLFRSKVPWLLVFDNLEDRELLNKYLPHGGTNGHVIVTTRVVDADSADEHQTLALGCFSPSESIQLLCRSAGTQNISHGKHMDAAQVLALRLGHLPLALGVAAAYMKRCDVDCSEYLSRYELSEQTGTTLGHEAVSSSLSLSLNAIKNENLMAWEALFLLSFLGPDNLTKPILRALLTAKQSSEKITAKDATAASSDSKTKHTIISGLYYAIPCGIMACTVLCTLLLPARRHIKGVWTFGIGTTLIGAWVAATIPMRTEDGQLPVQMDDTNIQPSSLASYSEGGSSESSDSKSDDGTPVDVFEMTDRVWTILKSYSLLDVKEGKGSMHRLLSHALQVYQTKNERHQNLEVCVRAIQQLWTFKPELVDSWQSASQYLDHVKSIVSHVAATPGFLILEAATLSREAGMLSAMALNRFVESQYSLELALRILDFGDGKRQPEFVVCKAACLHELGKVFRYHGSELRARETLSQALELRTKLAEKDIQSRRDVASTLHELGVLAVKNHNLSDAAGFLDQSLRLRQTLLSEFKDDDEIEAECAATLHQLAAVQVSRKPPCLDKAEALLRKALTLNMNIGQRAATMKQLARVAIRKGDAGNAEIYLSRALEFYVELFGENTLNINIAAVRFQQGALAFQREQLQDAWDYFSECLRARKQIYAYSQGIHLEISAVLHELGCVALAQHRFLKANELLMEEKQVLDEMAETLLLDHHHRLFHAKLTNLTWLRKCAKSLGDDTTVRRISDERADLKRRSIKHDTREPLSSASFPLRTIVLSCRIVARQLALSSEQKAEDSCSTELAANLCELDRVMHNSPVGTLRTAAFEFHKTASKVLSEARDRSLLLEACDDLRDVLRDLGICVNDTIKKRK